MNSNETRKKAKEKACEQFLDSATLNHLTTKYKPPHNLTPFALYNIDDSNAEKVLDAVKKVPKDNLLLLVLGEDQDLSKKLLDKHHAVFEQPFVKDLSGVKISILAIDPGIKIPQGKNSIQFAIDDSLKEKGVVNFTGVKAKFPLTPLFGPHKGVNRNYVTKYLNQKYPEREKKPNNFLYYELNEKVKKSIQEAQKQKFEKGKIHSLLALRRLIHTNALSVLNALVEHPGPLFISSRITSVCYRSFKYLIDVRATFERETLVRFGYTNPNDDLIDECVSAEEFLLFPNPFKACMSDMNANMVNKYYANKHINSNTKKEELRKYIKDVNDWADTELQKRIPLPKEQKAGKRRTRRNRKN